MTAATRFAFIQHAASGPGYQLATAAPDGSDVSVLPTPEPLTRPSFSPDGTTLLVGAVIGDGSVGRAGLYAAAVNGSGMHPVTGPAFADADVTYSPDGGGMAFARNVHGALNAASWVIFLGHPDGAAVRGLAATRGGRTPAFSREGHRLAYAKSDGLHVVNTDGSDDRLVTAGTVTQPAWSPDGTQIAFIQYTSFGHSRLVVRHPGGALTVVENTSGYAESPVWEPDGASLLYLAYTGVGRDGRSSAAVMQVAAGGGTPQRLFSYSRPIFALAASYAPGAAPPPPPSPSPSPSPTPTPTITVPPPTASP